MTDDAQLPPKFSPAPAVREGGVAIDGPVTIGAGDIVGRDKIVGYTAEQISALLAQISTSFQPKPFDGRSPYLGLDAFNEEAADRFFGRETLVADLIVRVKDSRFVIITGPSGSGKSSLIRAGLIHALKQSGLPDSARWLYETLTPGRDPFEALARTVSGMTGKLSAGDEVQLKGRSDSTLLHRWSEVALRDRPDCRAVIVIDQFEETFTQVAKEEDRLAFINLLAQAATVGGGRVTVLFVMRSDFVSACATYPQLNALLNQQFLQVGAMSAAELVSAIALPALHVGLRIDPDLIAQIINDMQDEPGALPLMQFALKDLFDHQQAKGGAIALTKADYILRGGIHKSLERHADAEFAKLGVAEQQLARDIFSGLIQVGRGTQDTRRTASFDELLPVGSDRASLEAVVKKLADARLVTTDEVITGETRTRTVTLAHEKLIEAWPWLRRLVNENRDVIALQNAIAEDGQEWKRSGEDSSYLYTGARLATVREQLDAKILTLSELAQTFVNAAISAEEEKRRQEEARRQNELARLRRRNRIITVVGALAIIAAGFAVFFSYQSNQNLGLAQNANTQSAQNLNVANQNAATAQAASTQSAHNADVAATNEANAIQQAAASRSLALAAYARNALANDDPDLAVALALA